MNAFLQSRAGVVAIIVAGVVAVVCLCCGGFLAALAIDPAAPAPTPTVVQPT